MATRGQKRKREEEINEIEAIVSEPRSKKDPKKPRTTENGNGVVATQDNHKSKSILPAELKNLLEKDETDQLATMTLNILVPMYTLLHSLKDEWEQTAGIKLEGITEPADLEKLLEKLQRAPKSKSGGSTPKPRTKKTPKPKDGIKKPRSAYQFFCNEQRPQLENLPFGDRAKEIGKRWKALSAEEKVTYQRMAEKDKERFLAEGGSIVSTPRRASTSGTAAKPKAKRISLSGHIAEAEGSIAIRSKSAAATALRSLKEAEGTHLIDISTKSLDQRWGKFCLNYPLGMLPVPFDENKWAMSVTGIFEGLKVFEKAGVSRVVMANIKMKALNRTEKKYGKLLGWSKGLQGESKDLLDAKQAREKLLIPVYKHVLENQLADEVKELKKLLQEGNKIVLLDENPNTDLKDYQHQLSPAILLKLYLENKYPQ